MTAADATNFKPKSPEESSPTRWTLVERLKDWDDQVSWKEFFDTYWRLIYAVATRSGLNDAEARDVVQETVITVAKKMGSFKADPAQGSFKSWLLQITRRRIVDQLRKRPPPGRFKDPEVRSDETTRTATVERVPDPTQRHQRRPTPTSSPASSRPWPAGRRWFPTSRPRSRSSPKPQGDADIARRPPVQATTRSWLI